MVLSVSRPLVINMADSRLCPVKAGFHERGPRKNKLWPPGPGHRKRKGKERNKGKGKQRSLEIAINNIQRHS